MIGYSVALLSIYYLSLSKRASWKKNPLHDCNASLKLTKTLELKIKNVSLQNLTVVIFLGKILPCKQKPNWKRVFRMKCQSFYPQQEQHSPPRPCLNLVPFAFSEQQKGYNIGNFIGGKKNNNYTYKNIQ